MDVRWKVGNWLKAFITLCVIEILYHNAKGGVWAAMFSIPEYKLYTDKHLSLFLSFSVAVAAERRENGKK